MSIRKWAEKEIELACKNENPDWDGKSFDYGCSCYKSALKAYNSLLEDNHSGYSIGITKNILNRLIAGLPLTPITDDDFIRDKNDPEEIYANDEWLKDMGMKDEIQCKRMSSLFKRIYLNGDIKYICVDRIIGIDINTKATHRFSLFSNMVDEMFPITMPYYPSANPFKVYVEDFLYDEKNGDFDTYAIYYIIKPDGERMDIDKYYKSDGDNPWAEISEQEFLERKKKRVLKEND